MMTSMNSRAIFREASGACLQKGAVVRGQQLGQKWRATATTHRSTFRLGVVAGDIVLPGSKPVEDWRAAEAERKRVKQESLDATAAAKAVYDKQQAAARGGVAKVPPELQTPLSDIPEIPYITAEGFVEDCSKAGAKATIYAIFDKEHALQYVGMSRSINPSLRLHLARMPSQCHYVKVAHVAAPNRAVLQKVQDDWVASSVDSVPGNDGGKCQNLWENALDCKTVWTDEDEKEIGAMDEGPDKKKALKNLARRFEAVIKAELEGRGIKEAFRFDPKLKDTGLLDLKNLAAVPDKVPEEKPK